MLCQYAQKQNTNFVNFVKNNFQKKHKNLALLLLMLYTNQGCDIDSNEARGCRKDIAGVPWSECQVLKLATSHCTKFKSVVY